MTNIQEMMNKVAENYSSKINDPIKEKILYGQALTFKTVSGRFFQINVTESRTPSNPYIYLKEKVNGKSKRIPKTEW